MRKSRRRKRRRRTRRKTTRRRRTRRERKTRTRTTTTTTTTSSSLASSSSLPSITTTTTRIQLVRGSKAWKTLSPKIQRLTDTLSEATCKPFLFEHHLTAQLLPPLVSEVSMMDRLYYVLLCVGSSSSFRPGMAISRFCESP